jgi:type IV pilus assembly protein PilE
MKKHKGFTLIELMITIVIVAILASIAIPSYRQYVIRGNRTAAQAVMMELATRQQQFFVANRVYAEGDETANDLGFSLPPEVADNYDFDLVAVPGPPPGFTITFTAKGGQLDDGNLTLNSEGVKGPAEKWKK